MASISAENVSVSFPIFDHSSRSVRQTAIQLGTGTRKAAPVINALRGITLNIRDGDRIGLIGHNGSGKSTFLRVLSGVYFPTGGIVDIHGSRSSLLNLHAGMDYEASGFENILLLGVSAGMSRRQVNAQTDDIIAFADLGEAIARPVRTYSAGMQLRLAFAVATAKAADIILIDEVISVGDVNFHERAKERLRALVGAAAVLVVASHDNDVLRANCNRGLVFSDGRIVFDGAIEAAISYSAE